MTKFVYPRLSSVRADEVYRELHVAYRRGGLPALSRFVNYSDPAASPIPTGGTVAPIKKIEHVRSSVVNAVSPWRARGRVPRLDGAKFDVALGKALHDALKIVPSDAAHSETWNFLTLIVMPDIAALRFPDFHEARFFGGQRNVLRSAWMRRDTLGDLLDDSAESLGVDELVGLFERSSMARNRPLVRALARTILGTQVSIARSDWSRQLSVEVRYLTGPLLLDGMSEEELMVLIQDVIAATPELSNALEA